VADSDRRRREALVVDRRVEIGHDAGGARQLAEPMLGRDLPGGWPR
jgi:hypothetical protein